MPSARATPERMRFYANGEGYVKIHASAREGMEGRVQLDCSSENGSVVSYPLHLLASSSPAADMPAPQSHVPTPKGSKVRPGLTEVQAQSLTDDELVSLGYTERPDALSSPDQYAKWLDHVSRPMTVLPQHLVSTNVTASPGSYTSSNWSGLEAHTTTKHKYSAVTGTWSVPPILIGVRRATPPIRPFGSGLTATAPKIWCRPEPSRMPKNSGAFCSPTTTPGPNSCPTNRPSRESSGSTRATRFRSRCGSVRAQERPTRMANMAASASSTGRRVTSP